MKDNRVVIENIDFKALKNQKSILFRMIQDWGEADCEEQKKEAEEVEGVIFLLDNIQDYAVDVLKMDAKDVYDME